MIIGYNIICLGNSNFEGHITSKQQIMTRLSKRNKVLYVNPGLSFLSTFSKQDELKITKHIKNIFLGVRRVSNNIYVVTPGVLLPFRFYKLPNKINSMIILFWIKLAIKKIGMTRPILWTFRPDSYGIIKKCGEVMDIYHCVDQHSATVKWWRPKDIVEMQEKRLIRAVDLVITTSNNLQKEKKELNNNCYCVPHAVDYEMFSRALNAETNIPKEISRLSKPIIGYIGTISPELVNSEFIEYAANISKYNFVFIGRMIDSNRKLEKIKKIKNVHFIGFKEPRQLPNYLKGIDVCIMPSVRSILMDAVFPLKLYEYLAAGKPIVATRTDELEKYSHLITLVNTPNEFLQAIDAALENNNNSRINTRTEAAKANTWDDRVETICSLIEDNINKKDTL